MTHMEQTSKKLKFEKPEIFQAEFLVCSFPVLTAKVPAAIAIAMACNIPGVAAAMPTAVVY